MATRNIENGLTNDTADTFITSDLIITGRVIWVDSVGGNSAYEGTFERPYDTLANGIGAATANAGDIIVVKSGHTQSLSSATTVDKAGVKIFGLGSGSSAPNFTVTGSGIDGIDITAVGVEINNLYFPVGTTNNNASRINVGAAGVKIKGCTFMCGARDINSITLPDAGDDCWIDSCTFTVSADGPDSGILVESATTARLRISNCTFNAASIGFDDGAIYSNVAHLNWIYDTITLTNHANIVHAQAAKGFVTGLVAGDDCHAYV